MLNKADFPVLDAIKIFAAFGKEATYFVPTVTGMAKSIVDAHGSLRTYLLDSAIHNYDIQAQGQEAKKTIEVLLVNADTITPTKMTLYRPESKNGDPRLWISGLAKYAKPWNLLAIFKQGEGVYIINMSDEDILASLAVANRDIFSSLNEPYRTNIGSKQSSSSPLTKLLVKTTEVLDGAAGELIKKLLVISGMGFVQSLRPGDTGVGMTLETLLGIQANSNRAPDYMGIEIKASRVSGRKQRSKTRVSLFSQVPDWKNSACKSGVDILKQYGYVDKKTDRLQLYCTNSNQPNPQGLFLQVDEENKQLESLRRKDNKNDSVVVWPMDNLKTQLEAKHRNTFWVKARHKKIANGLEAFHYVEVEQTNSPLVSNLAPLLEIGAITMDYTLSQKASGASRDHGYLFKIRPENFDLLFPPSSVHSLTS